jgi:hypothetical protein
MDTIFKFLHSIMCTLTLQISKLTMAVVLNSFPHGRFWQFVYKENVRCTRLMQRSLQVVIRQMFVLCSLKIEAQTLSGLSLCRSPFILLWGNVIQTEPSIGASHQSSAHLAKQFQRRRLTEIGQSETRIVWRPCLSTDRDEMWNLYRRPSIVASYQVSVHLAMQFERRRFL